MKNLFEPVVLAEVKERIGRLTPDSQRRWGTMSAAQTLAHCSLAIKMAMGEIIQPRTVVGRLFGPLARKSLLAQGKPMRRNAPAPPVVLVRDVRDLAIERQALKELLDRFAASGPAGCTKHPHFFFGSLTPVGWATLQYVHLDHHLRQFGE